MLLKRFSTGEASCVDKRAAPSSFSGGFYEVTTLAQHYIFLERPGALEEQFCQKDFSNKTVG